MPKPTFQLLSPWSATSKASSCSKNCCNWHHSLDFFSGVRMQGACSHFMSHACMYIQLIYPIDKSKTKVTGEEDIGQSAIWWCYFPALTSLLFIVWKWSNPKVYRARFDVNSILIMSHILPHIYFKRIKNILMLFSCPE